MYPVVMTIAGSDPSGGSGIQLDLKTIEAWDCHAVSALTALTVQDTRTVHRVVVLEPDLVRAQVETLFADLPVAAVKTGMLGDGRVVRAVAAALRDKRVPLVCDPVLRSTSGADLLAAQDRRSLLEELFPLAALVTPNAVEAAELTGRAVRDPAEALAAAEALRRHGSAGVLVKGGHLEHGRGTDVLATAAGSAQWPPRQDFPATRGTGCMLASSLAARLAIAGTPDTAERWRDAITAARDFVLAAARNGWEPGRGTRFARPRRPAGPSLSTELS